LRGSSNPGANAAGELVPGLIWPVAHGLQVDASRRHPEPNQPRPGRRRSRLRFSAGRAWRL